MAIKTEWRSMNQDERVDFFRWAIQKAQSRECPLPISCTITLEIRADPEVIEFDPSILPEAALCLIDEATLKSFLAESVSNLIKQNPASSLMTIANMLLVALHQRFSRWRIHPDLRDFTMQVAVEKGEGFDAQVDIYNVYVTISSTSGLDIKIEATE